MLRRVLPGAVVLLAMLAVPAGALAAVPIVSTEGARATSASAETVFGTVDPESKETKYEVVYGLSTSQWCETNEAMGLPEHETTLAPLGYKDEEEHGVAVHLTGLTGGTSYCAAVRAKNGSGAETAFALPFVAGEPAASTEDAHPTGASAATVTGDVNPAGQTTTYKALYDLSTSEWCKSNGAEGAPADATSPQTLGYSDARQHEVAVHLTALAAGTAYCAAIQATNPSHSATGSLARFTQGAPTASDFALHATSASSATLEGEVMPSGQSASYEVGYDVATSEWCANSGAKGSPAHSTAAQPLGFADFSEHRVAVHISGLTAGETYCAAIEATSAGGTATGFPLTLKAGAPVVEELGAQPTGATTASVSGAVDPSGQSTKYAVLYSPATSEWCTSAGAKGTPSSTAEQTLAFTDSGAHTVTVQLSSLTAGTSYCAAVHAANASAQALATQSDFTPGSTFADNISVRATGATTASVSALIGAGGESTSYKVLYGLATSEWCTSAGTKGSAESSTGAQALGFTDLAGHEVVVHLAGLVAGTGYCEAPQASNGSGVATGSHITVVAGAPTVNTQFVNPTGSTTASLSGSLDPSGQATKYQVLYDLSTSEWCTNNGAKGAASKSTPEVLLAATDASEHSIHIALTGLTAGTAYCAAVRASNASAAVTDTPSFLELPAGGSPAAETSEAFATGATTESVLGVVNASGQSTTYRVRYELATSEFCESEASTGKPVETPAATLAFTDRAEHLVAVDLTGLQAGHEYCALVVAANTSGTAPEAFPEPVRFLAGAPSAQATEARTTGATTATVFGVVGPAGQSTTYKVLYDLASSEWCESNGRASVAAHSTSSQALAFSDDSAHTVAVHLSALTAGAQYCAALQATNAAQSMTGTPVTFKIGEPSASTSAAQSTSATTAMVAGAVDPAGQSTTYKVLYDLAGSEWCESGGASSTPAHAGGETALAFTDESSHSVSAGISGLTGGTRYCAAIEATNAAAGVTAAPVSFTAGEPTASTVEGHAAGASAATVVGFVNPAGQTTTYNVLYALASSEWCESNGVSGGPPSSTAPATLGFTDAAAHEVSVELGALSSGREYCAAVQATNGTATATSSSVRRFTVGEPGASAIAFTPSAANAATVTGTVDPAGQTTTYKVVYDLAGTEWCESGGANGAPTGASTPATLGATDTDFHEVQVNVTGLTPGARYCLALQASNGAGTTTSVPLGGTSGAPGVRGTNVRPTGATGATLESEVDAAGQSTTYKVLYDLSTSEWCESDGQSGTPANTTSTGTLGFTDTSFHPVAVALSALAAGKTYCAAVEANTAAAAAVPLLVSFTVGQPSAVTLEGVPTGVATAAIKGTVDPGGQTTKYKASYAPATSEWCETEGESGTPSSTAETTLGSTGVSEEPVSVAITGLSAGTRYCAVLHAANASGSVTAFPLVTFTAGAPSATTLEALVTGSTTATVTGLVNPAGQTTTFKVLYDVSSSEWCESGGSSGAPSKTTTPQTLGFTDAAAHEVSVGLSGLTAGTGYCAALQAAIGSLTSTGEAFAFVPSAVQAAPSVSTQAASGVAESGATLHASVNPNGAEVSECKFEWGTTSAYGHVALCEQTVGSGPSPVGVSASIGGLSAGTEYHFRIVAKNSGGTSEGSDEHFKTSAPQPKPKVSTEAAGAITKTTATLAGKVNPEGSTVSECKFEYGSASVSEHSAGCEQSVGGGSSEVAVSAPLTGLAPNTTYKFRVSATNGGGAETGAEVSFTTLPEAPTVKTEPASSLTQAEAALNAKVNPNGAEVGECKFEWGTTTAYGHSASCEVSPGSGTAPVAVSAKLSGLSANTEYHYRVVAENAGGTTDGGDEHLVTFAALPKPKVSTEAAASVAKTTATLNGQVNPEGSAVTACKFEYGSTSVSEHTASCEQAVGSGTSNVPVSAALTGLAPNTTYKFRLAATNGGGGESGAEVTFQTLAEAPTVKTEAAGTGGTGGTGGSGGTGGGSGGTAPTPAQIAAQLGPSGKAAKLAAILKHAGITLTFKATEAGTMTIEWFFTPPAKHGKKAKRELVASGRAAATGAVTVVVTMRLTATGKRLLKGAKQLKITAQATFTPASGPPVKAARTFELRR